MEVLRGRAGMAYRMVSKTIARKSMWVRIPPAALFLAVTRSRFEFAEVRRLLQAGLNRCEIYRRTGISRTTIREWERREDPPGSTRRKGHLRLVLPLCRRCESGDGVTIDTPAYVYLLGLYLGDGCISYQAKGDFKLRIVLDNRYQGIIRECSSAMGLVSGRKVGLVSKIGCREVHAYWKHWPCLFPQHGPGRKHERPILLAQWQQELVDRWPEMLLRGLIHSDGCRSLNNVQGKIYPRYHFVNASEDIRRIFCDTCDAYGVRWRQSGYRTISASRRPDVAKLDAVIGPKA